MNLLSKNSKNRIAAAILFICAGQFLLSCSKDKSSEQVGQVGDSKLAVKVVGITDPNEITPKATVASKAITGATAVGTAPKKVVSYNGFDATTSVERDVFKNTKISLSSETKAGGSGVGLMAANVDNGVKYRLLLYKTDGTFVSSTLLTSGTEGEIDVVKGDSYNWYALSYNNTENVPDVDHDNPTLELPGGTDVLYASGEVEVPTGGEGVNIPLGITFQHSLAMVAIELNTMGMFADINTAALSVSGVSVKTGSMDLKTGEISNLTDYTQTIDYDSFTDVEPPYADRKVAYVYTADESAFGNLAVSLTNLVLNIDDNTTRSFQSVLSTNPSVFNFSNITPQRGSSYRALINLIESPLTLAGVRWARQNVYYTGGHNPYRFHHTYAHTNARNTYFSYKGLIPSNYGVDGDPCAEVYPEGVWRQASYDDFTTLTGLLGIGGQTPTYGSVSGSSNPVLRYVEYQAATGATAPYPSNNLRFNYNGSSISVSAVENIIQIDLGNTYGGSGDIWTNSSVLGIPGLGTGLGAWYFSGTRPLGINTVGMSGELLNVQVIGVDLVQTSFKNVRCVRATTN